jgi:hypothetical protein
MPCVWLRCGNPIKRARVVSDLYHAADRIRAHRVANNLAAEVERIRPDRRIV